MNLRLFLALVALPLPAGCAFPGQGGDEVATWTVDEGQELSATTTSFTALVERLGCNNGVTGDVRDPEITTDNEEVVITFTVGPTESRDVTCRGNEPVSYKVKLRAPLGQRSLVDGQCLPGAEAESTTSCESGPVRFEAPRAP